MPDTLPRSEGRYRILSRFARGGMSDLYLGEIREGGAPPEQIVLKRLRPELQGDQRYLRFFRIEAEVAMQLQHPNIVRVLDLPIIDGDVYLAMEYVDGKNLRRVFDQCVERSTTMPAPLALYVAEQMLRGLSHVHEPPATRRVRRVIHRDIKPANVLVSYDGEVKLTDFGIARADSASDIGTQEKELVGTASYLAPEQIVGRAVSERTDLYACGVVLVELLAGKRLFERSNLPASLLAVKGGERPPVQELLPGEPADLCELLERLLSTDPDKRPASATEVERALGTIRHRLDASSGQAALSAWLHELFDVGGSGEVWGLEPSPPPGNELPAAMTASIMGAEPVSLPGPRPPTVVDRNRRQDSKPVRVMPLAPPIDVADTKAAPPPAASTAPIPLPVSGPAVAPVRKTPMLQLVVGFAAGVATCSAVVLGMLWSDGDAAPKERVIAPAPIHVEAAPPIPEVPSEPVPPPPSPPPDLDEASAEAPRTIEPDGYVTIAEPRGAVVHVDGQRIPGRVPHVRIAVPPGEHELRIHKRRWRRTRRVEVGSGQEVRVDP